MLRACPTAAPATAPAAAPRARPPVCGVVVVEVLPAWAWQLAMSCCTCSCVWPCSGTTVSAKAGRQASEPSRAQRLRRMVLMVVRLPNKAWCAVGAMPARL
ncbi:hypothetical protein FQZ97_1016280 [compost metagenome]